MTARHRDSLEQFAVGLPVPKDLFAGVSGSLKTVPGNILQFLRCNDNEMYEDKPFFHYRFVLIACLKEPGGLILDGTLLLLQPGEGILVFPHQSHHYTRFEYPENIRWLFTTFEHENSVELEQLKNRPFAYGEIDLTRLKRVTQCYRNWLEGKSGAANELPLEIALLLGGLLRRRKGYIRHTGGRSGPIAQQSEFVQTVTHFIYRNINRRILPEELGKLVALSLSRLRAKFRDTLGISLGEFIRQMRIHKACELLHHSDLNISEIAESCGFESLFSFSRAFRRMISKSPTAFRKQIRNARTTKN